MDIANSKVSEKFETDHLNPEQKIICCGGGTERAFSGRYWDCKEVGTYECSVCSEPLFSSQTKFDSGSGWPSFADQIDSGCIKKVEDNSLGMIRIEIQCANCEAHLGHVFPDGPTETGQRYCVNSLSLDFKGSENDRS